MGGGRIWPTERIEAVQTLEFLFLVLQALNDSVHGGGHEGVGIFRTWSIHDHAGVFLARVLKKTADEIKNDADDAEEKGTTTDGDGPKALGIFGLGCDEQVL